MRGTLPVLQAHQQLLFGRRSFWPHAEPSLVAHLQPARRPCGGLQSRPGGLLVLSSISPERTQRHPSFPLNSNSAFANSGNANNIVEALAVEKFVRTTSRNGNGAESSSRLRVAVDVDEGKVFLQRNLDHFSNHMQFLIFAGRACSSRAISSQLEPVLLRRTGPQLPNQRLLSL